MAPGNAYNAAYQGQPGAFSEQAARRLCGAESLLLPCENLADAFDAVSSHAATSAVVPIENTLVGAVPGTIGLLLRSGLVVDGEVTESVDHVLAGLPGSDVSALREVLSHPVALAQCAQFFRRHRSIRAVPVFDTAGALQIVLRDADPTRAAIAGRPAAVLYGAAILAEHLQDHERNYTRFIRVSRGPLAPLTPRSKVMLAARIAHRPGALAALLQLLAADGINLDRIDSVPVLGAPFEYEFVLEGMGGGGSLLDHATAGIGTVADVRVIGAFEPHSA